MAQRKRRNTHANAMQMHVISCQKDYIRSSLDFCMWFHISYERRLESNRYERPLLRIYVCRSSSPGTPLRCVVQGLLFSHRCPATATHEAFWQLLWTKEGRCLRHPQSFEHFKVSSEPMGQGWREVQSFLRLGGFGRFLHRSYQCSRRRSNASLPTAKAPQRFLGPPPDVSLKRKRLFQHVLCPRASPPCEVNVAVL